MKNPSYPHMVFTLGLCFYLHLSSPGLASLSRPGNFLLPMNCQELIPDMDPFLSFFESVAQGNAVSDRTLSKRILRILALRGKVSEMGDKGRELNPADMMIRKTLCFYREQKNPLRVVPYDDPDFLVFLRSSLKELEDKIDAAILQWEMERFQRKEYERQLERNREVLNRLKHEAQIDADRSYENISKTAKRKIQQ